MAEENKHMNDAFKRMSEELKVSYNPSFWDEAKSKLDDATLDDAFKAAALNTVVSPSFEPADSVDDMFMDSAFKEAAPEVSVPYSPELFEQFMATEGDVVLDEAFSSAASAMVVDYLPEYWSDADKVLQNEGLHYEYQSAYWNEAKRLLDKSDRRVFFMKWSAVAAMLLLLSFSGLYLLEDLESIQGMHANNSDQQEAWYSEKEGFNSQIEANQEELLADRDFESFTDLNNSTGTSNQNYNDSDLTIQNLTNTQSNVSTLLVASVEDQRVIRGALSNQILTNRDLSSLDRSNTPTQILKNPLTATSNSIEMVSSPLIRPLGYERSAPLIKIEKEEPKTFHSVGLLAEAGIGNRWGEFTFLPTLRTSFGAEYVIASGKVFQNFEFGTNFKLNHIRQSQLGAEERSDIYDVHGNVTKYWRKLQLKDMLFANVNFFSNYRIAPAHKLKFGVGVEYLVGVRSNMSYVNDFTSEITTVNNNWGVKDGLNKFDLRFTVGYEYEVNSRFAIQLNSNFGVNDRTDNMFIGEAQKDNEINVMLGLKYNFLKKVK